VSSPVVMLVDPRGLAHCDPDCAELEGIAFSALRLAVTGYDLVLRRCEECCKLKPPARRKVRAPSRRRSPDAAQLTVYDELDNEQA
jgi:hypothetical protein